MKKRMALLLLTGCLAAPQTALAGPDTADVYGLVKRYNSVISDIAQKEKVLNSLKAGRTGPNMWNFAERRRRERLIQERSKISLEVSKLNQDAADVRNKLAGLSADFYAGLDENTGNRAYVEAYTGLEQVLADSWLSAAEPLNEPKILAATRANKQNFLQERLESQARNLNSLESTLKRLTSGRQAINGAGHADLAAELDKIIANCRSRIKDTNDSNAMIKKHLK